MERGEVAGNRSTRGREGGEHSGQENGGMACSDTRDRKRKGGDGFRPAVRTRTRAVRSTLSRVARAPSRRRLYRVGRARGSAAAAHAPGGDDMLTSGPGVERG
jgi:hypothetical protein